MNYMSVSEGKTSFLVPKADIPEHARKYGFYNPAMKGDRDLSVCMTSVFSKMFELKLDRKPSCCDLLSATGARAVRYAKESKLTVTANDSNENALELAKENASANNVTLELIKMDANSLLAGRSFDIIDIDPFGSPYPFMDSAARSVGDYGMLCITATDTATLFGVYPDVCERRYGIPSFSCDFRKELGTRILLSFVIRELAKYNKAFMPLLCYSKRHYVRLFGIVEKNADKVEEVLKKFNWLSVSNDSWSIGNTGGDKLLGKIYLGPIKNKDFCSAALDEANKREFLTKIFLSKTLNEIDSPFLYESETISKRFHIRMALSDMIFTIARAGFPVSYTTFSESAFKSSNEWKDLEKIIKFRKNNS